MSERVSLGATGRRLGVCSGDIRWAGYTKVTANQLEAWEHGPPAWLRKARARKVGPGPRQAGVSCCACGSVREVRPSLVKGYAHLVCGLCSKGGKLPELPSRPSVILGRTFNVAGYFDRYVHRVPAAEELASVHRAAPLLRAILLNVTGEPEP